MRASTSLFSQQLIERILNEARRVLSEVGIDVTHEGLRNRMLDLGLKLDATGKRLLFPADIVDRAIATTPGVFDLFDRDGNKFTEIGGDKVHFVPGSSGLQIQDHRSGELRLANTKDFVEYIRLCDGLPHIAYLATAFSTNQDIEPQISDAWRLYLCLTQSHKPIVTGAFSAHGVGTMAEMLQLFRRDQQDMINRPMSIFTITATGNLRYGEDSCQNLIDCVENGIPIEIVPVTLMGLIAPVSLVGATVFHTVDVLAGLVMAQLLKPGTPVLFGGAPATFNMKTATSPMSAIEALQLDVGYVEVAKYLNLPTQAYMVLSDSKMLDAQAGAESFGGALLAAMAGINSVSGAGMLNYVLAFSLPKLVFDNEMCGQALHFTREIEVKDDLPVQDIIDDLFKEDQLITAAHTLEHWPDELYLPSSVIDRISEEDWKQSGAHDLQQRASVEVDERIAAYQPVETDVAICSEMQRLITAKLTHQQTLPEIPPLSTAPVSKKPQRRRSRRQRQ